RSCASPASPFVGDLVEPLRRDAPVQLAVHEHRGRAGAVAEAVHRFERERAVGGRLMKVHAEPRFGVALERTLVHRLARFRATQVDRVPARRRVAQVVVEADDAVDLGAGQIQAAGNHRDSRGRYVPEFIMHGVQDGQQRTGHLPETRDDLGDLLLLLPRGMIRSGQFAAHGAQLAGIEPSIPGPRPGVKMRAPCCARHAASGARARSRLTMRPVSHMEHTTRRVNRWRIPIGAVAVHVCIGSVYAWSTFNRPIQALFPDQPWWFSPPYTTFTTALVLLGLSAAFGGPWVERRGPRVAATAAALFFGAGLIIGGTGLAIKEPILVCLGMGIIGGIGCGTGYISPVSTLVKCFPDRLGSATGMAIMGFGGGAFLAGYLNVFFMEQFGVATTMIALGGTYFVVMMIGARILRRPPE